MEIKAFIENLAKHHFALIVEDGKLILRADKDSLSDAEIKAMKSDSKVIDFIKSNKDAIINYLLDNAVSNQKKSKNVSSIYPLSPLQQGMLFHGLYDKKTSSYINQFRCDLTGVDIDAFTKSWAFIVNKHSILRSGFYVDSFSHPMQGVYKNVKVPIDILDYTHFNEQGLDKAIRKFEDSDRKKGFDFKTPPLMRITLVKISAETYRMFWTFHHILFDGWSKQVLIEELLNTYESLVRGTEPELSGADNYEEFIKYLEGIDKEDERSYWSNYLHNIDESTLLPFINADLERNKGKGQYESHFVEIDKETSEAINAYAQRNRITVNTLMQGVWAIVLNSYTGKKDIVYGVTVSGRTDDFTGIEKRVGLYINTIPLYASFHHNPEVLDWLKKIQLDQVASRQFQNTPLTEIQTWCNAKGNLFDNILVFENYPLTELLSAKAWSLKVGNVQIHVHTNYPLNLIVYNADQIKIRFEYNTNLLDSDYIAQIGGHFRQVLLQLTHDERCKLNAIKLITRSEEDSFLNGLNKSGGDYQKSETIVSIFEEQVEKTPNNVALVFGDEELTYKELNKQANQIAHYLRGRGVKQETLVPLCFEKGSEMITAILGVLKSGAAYVPIDPESPLSRISYVLKDTGAKIILSNQSNSEKLNSENLEVIQLDNDWKEISRQPATNLPDPATSQNLAYIIYTSGSTGQPKGVMIEHGSLYNYLSGVCNHYSHDIKNTSGSFIHLSYTFDASVTGIFIPLMKGKTVVIGSKRSVEVFEDVNLQKYAPFDFIKLTPSHLELLYPRIRSAKGDLITKKLVIGGEALLESQFMYLREEGLDVEIVNEYGPTEGTVGCSIYSFNVCGEYQSLKNSVPIGKPLANVQLFILNENNQMLPVGVPGEICIGGAGLARGYLNQPDLTREKFIQNPFNNNPEAKIYRTGDTGQWLSDGNLEFLGRKDDQVKIRGYRVELGEIETCLSTFDEIKNSKVIVAENEALTDKKLNAYLQIDNDKLPLLGNYLNLLAQNRVKKSDLHVLPNGLPVLNSNNNEVRFLYQEIFEDHCYLKHGISLDEDSCVVDVGANAGFFNIFLSALSKNIKVYAFEPIPEVYNFLTANRELYNVSGKAFQLAVLDEETEIDFNYFPEVTIVSGISDDRIKVKDVVRSYIENSSEDKLSPEEMESLLEAKLESKRIVCKTKTLSQIIDEEKIEKIDLLKVDVENSEHLVLKGLSEKNWDIIGSVIIEVHDLEGRLESIKGLLEEKGFTTYVEKEQMLSKDDILYNLFALRDKPKSIKTMDNRDVSRSVEWKHPVELTKSIRTDLEERLPDYMVPSQIILMDHFPLTPHGKIDKKALPAADGGEVVANQYQEAENELQQSFVKIWQDLLEIYHVGVNDDFFDIGGHSLLAIRLISAIRKELQIEIPINDIFDYPTVALLAERVKNHTDEPVLSSIQKQQRPEYIPLSFSQERLWFIDRLEGSVQYHLPSVLKLKGSLNKEALIHALQSIIRRHEVLRTVIKDYEGEAFQQIRPLEGWHIEEVDGRKLKGDLTAFIHELIIAPFNLSEDYMLRAHLIELSEQEHDLVVTLHHIASDGWSTAILVREVVELYNAFDAKRKPVLSNLPIQYADYAIWQRDYLQGEMLDEKVAYWKKKLDGTTSLQLPTDHPRPAIISTRGSIGHLDLSNGISEELNKLSQAQGTTLFMTLLAAFKVLLSRYSRQSDICVGTPVAGRQQKELEDLIGNFINTLALRIYVDKNATFTGHLQEVKSMTLEAYKHQEVPFEKVVEAVVRERDMSRSPLFQVLFTIQNTPDIPELKLGDVKLSTQTHENTTSQFDLLCILSERNGGMRVTMSYSTDLYTEQTINRMMGHFNNLLASIVKNPAQKIGELEMLAASEEKKLLTSFNTVKAGVRKGMTVANLFEEQASKHPNALAVVFEKEQLTFKDLNEKANRLAHYLRSHGVREEIFVPVCLRPSAQMIIAILGILKSGGVYVPIDPDYPEQRINFILQDTGAKLVISDLASKANLLTQNLEIIELERDRKEIDKQPDTNLPTGAGLENLAYVIYTSGSTGTPKGVMIEHRSLTDYLLNSKTIYISADLNKTGSFIHLSYTFDASLTGILMPLINGKLIVIGSKRSVDVFDDDNLLKYAPYDFIKITPSHLEFLKPKFDEFKTGTLTGKLVIGGESLYKSQLSSFSENGYEVDIINEYGPTEATVGCSTFVYNTLDKTATYRDVPIGKPIDNVKILILDDQLKPAPVGVFGEIHIGGGQLARGYLNNEELTKEKFIQDPYSKDKNVILYKSGDLGRWLEDGNIEFLGRKDSQVKIRGYRVEPGEIESALLNIDTISQSAVIAKDDGRGNKRLIGYVVVNEYFTKESTISQLKEKLPEYMIPQLWVELDSMPLTLSGKINKNALPDPDVSEQLSKQYTAPGNQTEKVLTEIWEDLLGLERVGIHDNFFELGGDSILTIQLVSRARRAGYEFQVGDVFSFPTIAKISALLDQKSESAASESGEQSLLEGAVGLIPIQQWYLEQAQEGLSHYNQSVLLCIDKQINANDLTFGLKELGSHHDALRMIFSRNKDGWEQNYGPDISELYFEDLTLSGEETLKENILKLGKKFQQSLDIEKGDLVRMVWIKTPASEKYNRLLIIIHHLVIDGVSWRILLEDLEIILNARKESKKPELGPKTASFRQWYKALEEYGKEQQISDQSGYWQKSKNAYIPLPTDKMVEGEIRVKDLIQYSLSLGIPETRRLLKDIPKVYHTEINDILICALAITISEWSNREQVIIGLDGHGRETITDDIDTSRTVGWFTNLYPVLLELEAEASTADHIKTVKEQLRKLPGKGIGYGVLKYINQDESLQGGSPWDIAFNYLGQLDNVTGESNWLHPADESAGSAMAPQQKLRDKITINCRVFGGDLIFNWNYSGLQYKPETIENIASNYLINLLKLITHCEEQLKSGPVYTPSDFRLAPEVSYHELDKFLGESFKGSIRGNSIESIYRLSGLQQGMLFHNLYEAKSGAYIEKFSWDLVGVVPKFINKSWNYILKNHSILRSAFYHDIFNIPVQCVYRDIEIPIHWLDYRDMSPNEQKTAIKLYEEADVEKGFDLKSPPLMRLTMIRLAEDRYRMVWTSHHILFDGWSVPVLTEEFLNAYEKLVAGEPLPSKNEDRYEDYILYLERQDIQKAKAYWKGYLSGVDHGTLLPFISATSERNKGQGKYGSEFLRIDTEATGKIQSYAQSRGITVNTLMQGVWSFLLHSYTGNKEITFGVTVSGRPDDLQGVEQRVGMFINTLPLCSTIDENQGLGEWLTSLQADQVSSRNFQYNALHDIQNWIGVHGDLFDTLLVFENYPISKVVASGKWSLKVEDVRVQENTNYPLTILIGSSEQINIHFSFNSQLLDSYYVKEIRDHFEHILFQIVHSSQEKLGDLQLLTPSEEKQLLKQVTTSKDDSQPMTIIELFEEQAKNNPNNIALVFEKEQLTYKELNEQSNRLARYLRNKGVKEETPVPVCLERGINMVIGILGILKAGGAYVPIDPEYPEDRIHYMIEDTSASIVLTSSKSKHRIGKGDFVLIEIDKDSKSIAQEAATNLSTAIAPGNLAYVIYTSGSTGKPKGVMIEHRNVYYFIAWCHQEFAVKQFEIAYSVTSICFDLSVFEIFYPLTTGKKIRIIENGLYLNKYLNTDKKVLLNCVPSLVENLVREGTDLSNVALLNMAGEPIGSYLTEHLDTEAMEIRNLYGPTEDTTYSTVYRLQKDKPVTIGKPIDNTQALILNSFAKPVPVGVIGEIYLGGFGIARGYLNQPELTNERFITDPFSKQKGARLYKTGDLGRWLPDGDIEYIGRADEQVKIRGFRIELGEIETCLLQSENISQCVVTAKEDALGNKRLVGYVVTQQGFSKEETMNQLREKLPEFMVPQLWVELAELPLTPNGKTDKKALPDPDIAEQLSGQYAAPRNQTEAKLAEIWQDLLGLERVGIYDNFFESGGDSILSIQLVSRAGRHGYHLQPKDIFIHQTIEQLSKAIEESNETKITGEQGILTGEAGLLPIQDWYLNGNTEGVSHYNQSILLSIDKEINKEDLEYCMTELSSRHDVLRMRYTNTKNGWKQEYGKKKETLSIEDLSNTGEKSLKEDIYKTGSNYQKSLDIEKGELFRMVWIKTPESQQYNRLLMVIHHLAVDGVSWRILLEDMELMLTTLKQNQTPEAGSKSSSYRQWFNVLEENGRQESVLDQLEYWKQAALSYQPIPVDSSSREESTAIDLVHHSVTLSKPATKNLLTETSRAYHTEINDLLLCSLAITMADWSKRNKVSIGLEGHGRESLSDQIDLSRTVGWFTSLYPVVLDLEQDAGLDQHIKTVKEQLRKLPGKGMGYGILKHINKEEALRNNDPWDIVFNYLGQLDNVTRESKWLHEAPESGGEGISPKQKLREKISINSRVQGGSLNIRWSYSQKHFKPETIEKLAADYLLNLEKLVVHCREIQKSGSISTPSDYGLATEVNYKELDAFLDKPFKGLSRRKSIQSIYRLSGLQQGMLFHNLYDENSGAYKEQLSCDFIGLNQKVFKESWDCILNHHSILRSAYYHDVFSLPVQGVYQNVEIPIVELDYSAMDKKQQEQSFKDFRANDLLKDFDLQSPPLMRIALIRLDDERTTMLWTTHHLLLDGWSLPIMMEEFMNSYEKLLNGEVLIPEQEDLYEDYIRYINQKNQKEAKTYWNNYLGGMENAALLPFIAATSERNKGAGIYETLSLQFNETFTKKIYSYSQQKRITVNTLMQGVWSRLLHEYTGSDKIIFGVVVSGRPDDLPEVERRVGLYINTLPFYSHWENDSEISQWLQSVQDDQVRSRSYQYTPLQDIQGWTGIQGDLFDSLLTFENYPVSKVLASREWSLGAENIKGYGQSNFPLTIIIQGAEMMRIDFVYNSGLLETNVINEISSHFENVTQQITGLEKEKLSQLKLLTQKQEEGLIKELNHSKVNYPKDKSVAELFEEQADKTPDLKALAFLDEELSYKELNEKANQLAHYLRSKGVQKETLVPLITDRGMEMVIGMLGIMKSGGAYVPVDLELPAERIEYILKDTNAEIVVGDKALRNKISHKDMVIVDLDSDWKEIAKHPSTNSPTSIASADSLAYIIYTSGSTGQPKGVMIEHRNLVDYVFGLKQNTEISGCRSFALVSTIATDLGNTVIYGSLLTGGTLHLFSKESVSNSDGMQKYFKVNKIDCLKIVPSHWKALSAEDELLLPEKMLIFGGEALPHEVLKRIHAFGAHCKVINHYGPTETTIGKLLHISEPGKAYGRTIPIGKPFSNTQVYVLNKRMTICPLGVPGELYIGGDGLARGYLNNDALTKDKFIPNPYIKNERIYGTGDLVKYLADGSLEYLGRIDEQVKIRGYRVELGEIEDALQKSSSVNQAAVLATEDKQGNLRLTAYIVAKGIFDRESVIDNLKQRLPEYMVPSLFMELEKMPLRANGKLNKKALPDPDYSELSGDRYVAPGDETEEKLAEIWKDILEVDQVGIHDDFFELGGHSLLAIRLISAIRKTFEVEMPIGDIFDFPTIALLKGRLGGKAESALLPPIGRPEKRPDHIPLSFSQERLWFIDKLDGSLQYHVPSLLRLQGKLNKEALVYSFKTIVSRHEVLRTAIVDHNGEAYQQVNKAEGWQLMEVDGTQHGDNLKAYINQLIIAPFNLSEDYMLRCHLIKLSEDEHDLLVTLHHIASDGWSTSVIVKELAELYQSFAEGREATLPKLEIQYADFSIWQRKYIQGDILENKLSYWREKLNGLQPCEIQSDFPRPPIQSTRGAICNFKIKKEVFEQLKGLCQQQGTTMFMTLLSAFKVLLHRYSDQEDICIGTPITGRQQQEVENLVGFFLNTLALRSTLKSGERFKDVLQQIKATTLEAFENKEVPFEKVVEAVVKERDMSRSPLFQNMFIFHNNPEIPDLQLGNVKLSRQPSEHKTSKFDLTFSIMEMNDELSLAVEYCTDLFSEQTIEQLAGHYKQILNAIVTEPEQKIDDMEMLTPAEKQQLLHEFNLAGEEYPKNKTIIDLFEEQSLKTPDAIAVAFEKNRLTYKELNEKSNQLAHYLIKKGVKQDTLVPICMERGFEMIIGVLGILKSGGAYVPVDPEYPDQRIRYILEDIKATIALCNKESAERIRGEGLEVIETSKDRTEIEKQPTNNPSVKTSTRDLTYVLYTSGSTGIPKGVQMNCSALVNLLHWQETQFTNKQRSVLQFANLNFDVSFQEIFSTLCFGGQLCLISSEHRIDISELLIDISNFKISHLFIPYVVLKNIAEYYESQSLNTYLPEEIIVAGEQLKINEEIKALLKKGNIKLVNQYGPTEAHVVSSYTINREKDLTLPPIGKPVPNNSLYLLNSAGGLMPRGGQGEIHIGGVQVARGYVNNEMLTAEKFINDPFSQLEGSRLYKTGDLGRWLPDGNLEYIGRIDDQVKIRGFRVELGEIEIALQRLETISQSVVLAREDPYGNKRLVGYVVVNGAFNKEATINSLKEKLPEYMVPQLWVELQSFPTNRNGKIDKKSLPDPDLAGQLSDRYVAPRSELETKLAAIWGELLNLERVGIHDNFFELGGHSLLAMRVISSIRKELEMELAIKKLFIYPTIEELALYLEEQIKEDVLSF